MRLLLVRHGQIPSNITYHLDTDEPGPGLTGLGREQALALPETLGGEGIEAIYASTLLRTQQTAAPLARALGLEVQIRRDLREIPAGSLEMANDETSIQTYLSVVLGWAADAPQRVVPGTTQDGYSVLRAFDEVVEEIAGTGVGVAAIISHGSMIRVWAASRAENITPDFAAQHPLSNTGAVLMTGEPGRWRAERWQEHALGGPELTDEQADGPAADTVQL
ncbi:histidine phosphatase family protein [Microbacterium sp. A93]|uniref:histidine phosphatase family protein n=1 Tax=Microbacterium sp. A93 TaxID=3450716 RepID=UPI003F42957C